MIEVKGLEMDSYNDSNLIKRNETTAVKRGGRKVSGGEGGEWEEERKWEFLNGKIKRKKFYPVMRVHIRS